MRHQRSFRRILLDIDLHDLPIGLSVETWTDDSRVGLTVLPIPGPFTTCHEALADALAWCDDRHGLQAPLF